MSKSPHTPEFRAKVSQEYLTMGWQIQNLVEAVLIGEGSVDDTV